MAPETDRRLGRSSPAHRGGHHLFPLRRHPLFALGSIGLTAYLTAERTKEIGIRRVLRPSEKHVIWHFTRRFALLVAIAITVAFPAAFYLTERWLMQFQVRVEPSYLSFLLIALALFITALLSITIQARQAARRNAVDTLRYE